MQIMKPEMSEHMEQLTTFSAIAESDIICEMRVSDLVCEEEWVNKEFQACCFDHVDFSNAVFDCVNFINVIFRDCDLSNVNLTNASIHRVTFENCKLLGSDFSGSSIKNVTIMNSQAKFANFSFALIDGFEVVDTNLEEASLNEIKWKHVAITNCVLKRCEFLHTPLKGIDLSTCSVAGIKIDQFSFQGVIISQSQAASLIQLFGAVIKD